MKKTVETITARQRRAKRRYFTAVLTLALCAAMMDVGGGPAVLGQLDIGMLENVVLLVNDRPLAPDKDDGVGVVHGPHFIWCK